MGSGRWVAGFCLGLLPATAAWGGGLEGRVGTELEYLGQSYFSEQQLTALDLGLPSDSGILIADTTRFHDDTWLPGQHLELGWRSSPERPVRLRVTSRTEGNRERFSQDLDVRGEVPAGVGGRWRFGASGAFRDDERSLIGHGDWRTALDGAREVALGPNGRGTLRLVWEHSRTRGDTTSYLYDYDLLRARLGAGAGAGWLPVWEGTVEGTWKRVPGDRPGGYGEVRAGGSWRKPDGAAHLDLDLRFREYAVPGVGRDVLSLEAGSGTRILERGAGSLSLRTRTTVSDYRGEDELYFDALEVEGHLPWQQPAGDWTLTAGPAGGLLVDLDRGGRDYVQGSVEGGLNRLVGAGGFVDLSAEAGYRDYRSGAADWIEIATLSTSVLRSDTWLFEVLGLADIPLGSRFTLNVLASSSWEIHVHESERVQVTYASLGIGRLF